MDSSGDPDYQLSRFIGPRIVLIAEHVGGASEIGILRLLVACAK